ncbi:MAG: hypothetical protein JWO26_2422 [Rhodospirillales bacterium]|jgi:hypothetical protein|nr:hypothetical protein [Rhodospirillales bacterium]
MKRAPRTGKPKPGTKATNKPAKARPKTDRAGIERLSRELDEAQAKLCQTGEQDADAFTAKKIETLIEAALTARGQALEAALERAKAQGELRELRDAIQKAPGPMGWLLRRAARRVWKDH